MMPVEQFIKCFYVIPKKYGYFKYVDKDVLKQTLKSTDPGSKEKEDLKLNESENLNDKDDEK